MSVDRKYRISMSGDALHETWTALEGQADKWLGAALRDQQRGHEECLYVDDILAATEAVISVQQAFERGGCEIE